MNIGDISEAEMRLLNIARSEQRSHTPSGSRQRL